MKFKITAITSLLLAMSVTSGYANVQVQGINYDPSGSLLFQKGGVDQPKASTGMEKVLFSGDIMFDWPCNLSTF